MVYKIRYWRQTKQYISYECHHISISFSFWKFDTSNRIIHAKSINVSKKSLWLTILEVDSHNNFTKRIDSPVSKINQESLINNARINSLHSSKSLDKIEIPTNLSINNLRRNLVHQKWFQFGDWICNQKLSKSGIAVLKYQLFYYKQLLKPLAMAIMSLVAAGFLTLMHKTNYLGKY